MQNPGPRRKLYQKKQLNGKWSLKSIAAHRLALENKTLTQLKVFVECTGSLGQYFETNCPSDENWKEALKAISVSLPHGMYALRNESYRILQPDAYPYEIEEDKTHVINEVKRLREQGSSQQPLNRQNGLRRTLLSPEEDEPEAKKLKTQSTTIDVKHPIDDPLLTEHSDVKTEHPIPEESKLIDLVSDFKDDDPDVSHSKDSLEGVEIYVGDLLRKNEILAKEVRALRKEKGFLQKKLADDQNSKTVAIKLQQRLSTEKAAKKLMFRRWLDERNDKNAFIQDKDEQIKKLHYSNHNKDLLIENLLHDREKERARANSATQSLDTANQSLQVKQREIAEKDNHFSDLKLRNDHLVAVFAREKQLRSISDRRADDAVKDGQKTHQQYLEAVRIAQSTQQRVVEVSQRLEVAESDLMAVRNVAQNYLADDERRLRARRMAMQQWSHGNER